MRNILKLGLLSCAAIGPFVSVSVAQDEYFSRDKYEAVLDRVQPEFDAEAIRVGAFNVRSSAQLGVTSNSNVFASGDNETSDIIMRIGGQVEAKTNWTNNEISASVGVFRNEYSDISAESNTDARARLRGRLDVTRALSVAATGFIEQRSEPRQEFANAVGVDGPIRFDRAGGELAAYYHTGRLRWDGSVSVSQTDFDDGRINSPGINFGQEFDQDYRDQTLTTTRSRVTYAVTPDFAVFGQGSLYNRDYDRTQLLNGSQVTRDSEGYTLAVGANFELSSLIRGDVAVGYFGDDKVQGAFQDVQGLSLDGQVVWFPTQLTNVTFTVDRRVLDLGLIETPTALQTGFGVRVDHEFRRNVIGSVYANIQQQDYDDVARTDDVFDITVSGTYKLNRRVHLEGFLRQIGRDVSGAAQASALSHDISLIGIGVKVSP